ncbi:MAG: CarD family transcriptional regulator, partial [Blastocatellia bacterium]
QSLPLPVPFQNRDQSAPLFLFPPEPEPNEVEIISRSVRRWHGHVADLARDLKQQSLVGNHNVFVLPSTGVADRIRKMLAEYEVPGVEIADFGLWIADSPDAPTKEPGDNQSAIRISQSAITLIVGDVSVGFSVPTANLSVYTEADIFDEAALVGKPIKTSKKKRSQSAAFISDFRDLKIGDYVVHIDHGIGQFQGLIQIDTQGEETSAEVYARMIGESQRIEKPRREFMLLTYADGARLYVPVERLDLVQKFSSGEMSSPSLDKLGGIAWAKTKAKAKRAMRDMAEELLKLYAQRKLVTGYAFSGDTPWQQEFEAAFPYELTPDQAKAIEDAKRDMEQPMPMDRLLCGDVGYGKTEVAMR